MQPDVIRRIMLGYQDNQSVTLTAIDCAQAIKHFCALESRIEHAVYHTSDLFHSSEEARELLLQIAKILRGDE